MPDDENAARVAQGRAEHARMVKGLKRRKIGDRRYAIIVRATGEQVAIAAQVGEHGRDNYPWDVYGDDLPYIPAQDSLSHCIEKVAELLLKAKKNI